MVSRRARSSKEKGPFASFGQFMLPLAVIMALALLFFSVRLFFFGSSEEKRTLSSAPSVTESQAVPAPQPAPAPPAPVQPAAPAVKPAAPSYVAGPVTDTSSQTHAKPVQPAPSAQQQPKPQPVKPVKPAPAANSGQRFDVQIGSFASSENAQNLAKKAKAHGYDVYLSETTSNGKPFYRVRVKGESTREAAQALAQKLEGNGYPTLIVPPGK